MIIIRRISNKLIAIVVYLGAHGIYFWCSAYGTDGIWNILTDFTTAICDAFKPCWGETNDIPTALRIMEENLNERLHGQEIARKIIIDTMKQTYKYVDGGMPLSVELYGPPGTGKTYATEIIAEAVFRKGMNSSLIHTFDGEDLQFLEEQLSNFEENLQYWIKGNLSKCRSSMFIFKHTEKIPSQLLDVIQNVIRADMGGIFLFTTRETGPVFSDIYYKTLQRGTRKEYLHIKRFAPVLRPVLALTTRALFLPLEDADLKNCLLEEFERQGYPIPSICLIGETFKIVRLDGFGNRKLTCKEITEIAKHVTAYKCQDIWG